MIIAAVVLAAAVQRVQVRFVPDEAEAVLSILDTRAAHHEVADAQWKRLFASEGYVRLKKREAAMKRPFDDAEFRDFVLSDALLAKREMLARTLHDWTSADLSHAAAFALAYLPSNATIRAKVYPVIKPKTNSFVFEVKTDPAIFMYVDDKPRAELERPDAPPQTDPALVKVWRDEMAKFDANFAAVAAFLTDLADGRLSEDAAQDRGMEFFGTLGPWYTVGWKMAVVIEKTLGRDTLVSAFCDPRQLLGTYNRAAKLWQQKTGEKLPLWPAELVEKVTTQRTPPDPAHPI